LKAALNVGVILLRIRKAARLQGLREGYYPLTTSRTNGILWGL
jgi:hypothetical protein